MNCRAEEINLGEYEVDRAEGQHRICSGIVRCDWLFET